MEIGKENYLDDYEMLARMASNVIHDRAVGVKTDGECARICTSEKTFSCRSFDVCKVPAKKAFSKLCLLSRNHIHNVESDAQVEHYPDCTHYSSTYPHVDTLDIESKAKTDESHFRRTNRKELV